MYLLENHAWMIPLLRHLWQSTAFAAAMWLLSLALRRNAARLRYRLWMAASLKFLLPFSLLVAVGARLPWPAHLDRPQPTIAAAVETVAQPILLPWTVDTGAALPVHAPLAFAPHSRPDWLPVALLVVWAAGSLLLLFRWTAGWFRLRAAVRRGQPIALPGGTPALLVPQNIEPGVFGIFRPVLLLPRGIAERLSAEQLDAIVAHECCHMRRCDNLTAVLHMAVEALFWFHPLVWWLRARLVEERERACDEAVLAATAQPFAYAEGILNVCKFYVEAPLSCVSGVTGSELKQRIVRILSPQAVRQLDLPRKMLLALASVLLIGAPLTAGLLHAAQAQTQPPAPTEKNGIVGTWQGTAHLQNGRDWRLVLKIAKNDKDALNGTMYLLDDAGRSIAASSVSFANGTLRFANDFPGFTYEGKLAADGNSIAGTITQNGSFPLVLERATPDTAWTIPAPPPRLPPMAADAHPAFEVATIKPGPAGSRQMGFRMRGAELSIQNLSLEDVIKFAWQVQSREIVGAPAWMSTDKWDIEAKPDTPGMPSSDQMREMIQKLLADRFALRFHQQTQEMAAYILTVGKDGPRLTKSSDSSIMGGFTMGPLGVMHAGGASMNDFVHVLQGDILDRPVVDKTGLTGRWNFTLKWLPDETQFAGVKAPRPADDDANPLPPLFTAIQEQLGLKLEAQKADVPVLVIDHVDHPTPN
jgi:uncharacterized protein (TIGR03435 family)